jgi:hypothetical protein
MPSVIIKAIVVPVAWAMVNQYVNGDPPARREIGVKKTDRLCAATAKPARRGFNDIKGLRKPRHLADVKNSDSTPGGPRLRQPASQNRMKHGQHPGPASEV